MLEVPPTATAGKVRGAYRRLAGRHHPDRVQAHTADADAATARMAAINGAYELIHDGPLRHHPIARPFDPDVVFVQGYVDEALRRARAERQMPRVQTIVGFAGLGVFVVLFVLPKVYHAGFSYQAAALIAVTLVAAAFLLRRTDDQDLPVGGLIDLLHLLRLFH